MAAAGETMARPVNLVQASQSRLGETNRDSPKPVCARGRPGDPLKFWASEHLAQVRGVSPKRDPALRLDALFEPSPRRRGLAWAKTSRLSEAPQPERGAGQDSVVFGCLFISGWSVLVGYECYDEGHVYNGVWCIRSMIHEL